MPTLSTKFSDVLRADQRSVDSRLDQFEQMGILELFDRMLERVSEGQRPSAHQAAKPRTLSRHGLL